MKKYLLLIIVLISKNIFSQNTNVYDLAPSAKVTTNGTVMSGGATARSPISSTDLSVGQYIILDFGTLVPVHAITFGTFWSSDPTYIPRGYTIDYSNDGATWTNYETITGNSNLSPSYSISLPWTRYWKITITAVQAGQSICKIAGLQLLSYGVGAATNNFYWNTGGINSSSITYTGGNVGIGTINPNQKLEVSGSNAGGEVTMRITNSSQAANNITKLEFADGGASAVSGRIYSKIRSGGNSDMFFGTANTGGTTVTDQMVILSEGNVGIGTTNPGTYRLAVEGTIGARKVKVTTAPWADYVFEDQYKLPSLTEVEAFINKYKHLPEVPTTKEVEANGLDLGDNQALLLKKIEELTLYVIEQNKNQKELTKQVQMLQEENRQLKNRLNIIIAGKKITTNGDNK